MKNPIPHLPGWLALALLLSPASAFAHTDPPKMIGLLVEYYEIDHAAVPPLVRAYQNESGAAALLGKVQAMEAKGEARLVESTYTVTRSGQRAKIESIREVISPTGWDPAEVAPKITGPIDPDAAVATPATPTAYEMRPVGNTVEFDVVVAADGIIVEINLAPELVEFRGLRDWGQGLSTTQAPLFHAMKTQTSITTRFGGCELLGVFNPSSSAAENGRGKRVLGFISALRRRNITPEMQAMEAKFYERIDELDVAFAQRADDKAAGLIDDDDPFGFMADEDFSPFSHVVGELVPVQPRQVSLLTEYIEVDAHLASQLVRDMGESCDATAIRARLDGVIAEGEASILETNAILTRSGMRSKSESTDEFIYPTEFNTARIPQELHGPLASAPSLIVPVSPNAFELRPVGLSVEADPIIEWHGLSLDINIAPELVRHVGNLSYGTGPATSEQPLFETLKIQTAIAMPDGTAFLLGMHSLETARAGEAGTEEERAAVRDRRVLVFLTAKVKVVE